MARYIDADALIADLHDERKHTVLMAPFKLCTADRVDLKFLLNDAPTVDAAPVVHGEWINTPPYTSIGGEYKKAQRCSVCNALYISAGNTPYSNHRYCAECGAKMDGGVK